MLVYDPTTSVQRGGLSYRMEYATQMTGSRSVPNYQSLLYVLFS